MSGPFCEQCGTNRAVYQADDESKSVYCSADCAQRRHVGCKIEIDASIVPKRTDEDRPVALLLDPKTEVMAWRGSDMPSTTVWKGWEDIAKRDTLNGWSVFRIPARVALWKGVESKFADGIVAKGAPAWYGNVQVSTYYGLRSKELSGDEGKVITVYSESELVLLDVLSASNMTRVYKEMVETEDDLDSLNYAFKLTGDKNSVKRKSDIGIDIAIANMLCGKIHASVVGWAHAKADTGLYAEIMLCQRGIDKLIRHSIELRADHPSRRIVMTQKGISIHEWPVAEWDVSFVYGEHHRYVPIKSKQSDAWMFSTSSTIGSLRTATTTTIAEFLKTNYAPFWQAVGEYVEIVHRQERRPTSDLREMLNVSSKFQWLVIVPTVMTFSPPEHGKYWVVSSYVAKLKKEGAQFPIDEHESALTATTLNGRNIIIRYDSMSKKYRFEMSAFPLLTEEDKRLFFRSDRDLYGKDTHRISDTFRFEADSVIKTANGYVIKIGVHLESLKSRDLLSAQRAVQK